MWNISGDRHRLLSVVIVVSGRRMSDVGRWTLDVGHWTLDVGRRSSVQIEQRQRRDNFAMLMAANLRKIAVQGAQSIPNANASVCVDWFIRKGAGAGHTKNLQKSFKKQANGDRA